MRDVAQPNPGAATLAPQRQPAIDEAVTRHEGDKEVAEQALGGEFRPGEAAAVGGGFGAVAGRVQATAVEAQQQAREEVGGDGEEEEEEFRHGRLVVGSCEEEEGVGFVEVVAAREEGD